MPLTLWDQIATEALKLRTIASTRWFACGLIALLLLLALVDEGARGPESTASLTVGLTAVSYFGQHLVAAFGLMVITAELATRSITVTFAATPRRHHVVMAKAAVAFAGPAAVGAIAAALGIGLAGIRAGEFPRLIAPALEQVAGTGLYLGLLAVIALGIGALVRRTAGALAIMILLLVIVPELLRLAGERFGMTWLVTFSGWTPAQAGWALMTGDWVHLLTLTAWAAAAIAAGWWALARRDA